MLRGTVGPEAQAPGEKGAEGPPEVTVMASGCLGLISFPQIEGRATLEQLDDRYPGLVETLRTHPGIGFVLVHSDKRGAVVLGRSGTNYLDEKRIEGDDPLASFGPNAALHVKRTDTFPHCQDIMVNSTYWTAVDEVAAFEGCGSHGGMGGTQNRPFTLYPSDWAPPSQRIVGAENVHLQFVRGSPTSATPPTPTYRTTRTDSSQHRPSNKATVSQDEHRRLRFTQRDRPASRSRARERRIVGHGRDTAVQTGNRGAR